MYPFLLTSSVCKCRSLQYIMPLSLLLPSALLPLPPNERAMDLQLEVLGGGGVKGSGVILKMVVCKNTSHQELRASYRVSGSGEQCQIVSGSTNFPSQLFALCPATGREARFFQDIQHTSTSLWPCIRARGACRTTSGYTIMPPGHFSTHKNHLYKPSRRPRS